MEEGLFSHSEAGVGGHGVCVVVDSSPMGCLKLALGDGPWRVWVKWIQRLIQRSWGSVTSFLFVLDRPTWLSSLLEGMINGFVILLKDMVPLVWKLRLAN